MRDSRLVHGAKTRRLIPAGLKIPRTNFLRLYSFDTRKSFLMSDDLDLDRERRERRGAPKTSSLAPPPRPDLPRGRPDGEAEHRKVGDGGERGGVGVGAHPTEALHVAAVAAARGARVLLLEPAREVLQVPAAATAGADHVHAAHQLVAHHAPGRIRLVKVN